MTLPPRDPDLRGQHVVITGVGRPGQSGEIVAEAFAALGASLHLIDRDPSLAASHAATFPGAQGYACDLTDAAALGAVAAQINAASNGRLAALVNLAGGFAMSGPVEESDPAVLDRMIAINLTTAYLATRAFLPMVRAAQGTILYVGTQAALPGGRSAGTAAYTAAKAGVIALMRSVAEAEAKHGVTANAVAPSAIRTATNLADMGDKASYVERGEFAAALVQLCAPSSRRITGQVIPLG